MSTSPECLSDDAAAGFVEGRLAPPERMRAEGHVDTCASCRKLISQLARLGAAASDALALSPTLEAGTDDPVGPSCSTLLPGTVVGRYVIARRLGQGAMGTVYAARDPELEREVALKLLHRAGSGLLAEAQAMARISHPNVIAVFDVGTFGEHVFLAMELVAGSTLADWLRADRRAPAEIVRVFAQAARGLAAAHAAGVVHRDFKPDNVLCARDGRVFVTDFGLASPAGIGAGEVAGTPAYMSPEQLGGQGAGPASVQFSFCVALWEALYHERPFAGATPSQVAASVLAGVPREPARRRGVPRRWHRILTRGLCSSPDDRFASMTALVLALERRPLRRSHAIAIGVAAVLLAAGAGAAGSRRHRENPCEGADRALSAVWDAGRRSAVRAAFAKANTPYAMDAWNTIDRLVGAYTAGWSRTRKQACEATRVRGEQSDELLTLRMACLDRQLAEVNAFGELLIAADAKTVERSVQAAASLPRIEACSDTDALLYGPRAPRDPETRAKVEAIRGEMAATNALVHLGKFAEARTRIVALRDRALALSDRALAAECEATLGTLQVDSGDPKTGVQTLYQALADAEHAGAEEAKAIAWTELVHAVGYLQAQYDQGLQLAALADAALDRPGADQELRAVLLSNMATIAQAQDKPARALELFTKARTMLARLRGDGYFKVGLLWTFEANALVDLARYKEALADFDHGLAIVTEALGTAHPFVGITLANQGLAFLRVGRLADALTRYRRALAIAEAALPAVHPQVADALHGVALGVMSVEGDPEKARALFLRALEIRKKLFGADHPDVALTYLAIAQTYEDERALDKAIASARTALAIWGHADPSSTAVADASNELGSLLLDAGKPAEARIALERARTLQDKLLAPDHPDRIDTLDGLGRALLQQGHAEAAVALLDEAVELARTHDLAPLDGAQARFDLAQALSSAGKDPARARALATAARDAFAAHPRWKARQLRSVEHWLASHGGSSEVAARTPQ